MSREVLQSSSALAVSSAVGLAFVAWSGTQLYVVYCAPSGVFGFVQSLVTMDSSPCQALFSVIHHSQSLYSATIGALLFAFISFLGSFCSSPKRPVAQ
jgi:hypothetical protein